MRFLLSEQIAYAAAAAAASLPPHATLSPVHQMKKFCFCRELRPALQLR